MEVVKSVKLLREHLDKARAEGKKIGLVPTMGALHQGHMSLVERARAENDVVVVSVFVNPKQFNNPDDLRTYPRTEEADCRMLEAAGVDYALVPEVEEMYPEPDTRVFDLGDVSTVMEGAMRPGHFNGVCQIVSKLFDIVGADRAYFGEKDFQQIAVIRRMVEILGKGPEIVPCAIKRADDGLALSSRNVRLSPEQRAVAPGIYRTLKASVDFAKNHTVDETISMVQRTIDAMPYMKVEYFALVDGNTMQPISDWNETDFPVGCITVYCGDVRLIDNIKYVR